MLKNYWPTSEECNRCINTDAEATAEHVLLAVHEPMTLSLKQNGKIQSGDKSEYDFLSIKRTSLSSSVLSSISPKFKTSLDNCT